MSGYSFDANIVIDALKGWEPARNELRLTHDRWISRVAWIEVMSKVGDRGWDQTGMFLTQFEIDEVNAEIAARAALLRNGKPSLKLADAVILASAQACGRILVTRNTKDFPATMPGVRVPYII